MAAGQADELRTVTFKQGHINQTYMCVFTYIQYIYIYTTFYSFIQAAGQLSIATSKNPSVVNTIPYIYI